MLLEVVVEITSFVKWFTILRSVAVSEGERACCGKQRQASKLAADDFGFNL